MRTRLLRFATVLFVLSFPVLALAEGPTPAPTHWYPLAASGSAEPARLEPGRSFSGDFQATIRIPGLLTGTTTTTAGVRGLLEIPEGGLISDLGLPRIPVVRRMMEIPAGAKVSAALEPVARRTMTVAALGFEGKLLPVQLPVPKTAGAAESIPFVENAEIFGRDAYFPENPVAVVSEGILRGRHVALVEMRPVRYNPVRGLIEVWTEARLTLTITGGVKEQAARDASRLRSQLLDPGIESALTPTTPRNPAPAEAKGSAGGAAQGAEGMLVIVNDAFTSAVQPFVDWKKQTGFKVEVLETSALGTSPTDTLVKNAIQARYNGWSNPSLGFVLLVGDTGYVPIHNGTGGGNSQVTDNWYACLDGSDYLPDLAIARISTQTAQETTNVVNKLLTYEKATTATEAWVKKAGFIGTSDSGHISLIEGTHDYCIDTFFTPNGYLQTSWSHGHASSDRHYNTTNATTSDISASINEGRSIVNYSGHGSTDSWQGPTGNGGYDQANVRANSNDGMYPFVISNACLTGSLEQSECFAETWQKVPNKGAIAFWGASNSSYWDEDDYLQRQLYTHIFPLDSTPPIGVIRNQTLIDLYTHYGNTGTVSYYFEMYNLLSEPSLFLWTRAPRTMTVSFPGTLAVGDAQFEVTVTFSGSPVANALVAVQKTDNGVFESGYTDSTGKVTFTLDPAPTSPGPMAVTVTKHDFRPFEGTSTVITPDSPWLSHRSHVLDDAAGGDHDGIANPGETILMPVTVENIGMQPGTGLSGTLTTSTPDMVEILDHAASFPDLAVNQQGTSLPDHFQIRVKNTAPDGAPLGFNLNWMAAGGSTGTTVFSDTVYAVDFAVDHHTIDDTIAGDGNGVAGPGETVDMVINLANVGHKHAGTIHGTLSTASPYVTILQAEADFPDLAIGTKSDSLPPPFRFSVSTAAPDNQPVTFTLNLTEQATHHDEAVTFEVMVSSCAQFTATDVPKTINDNSTVDSLFDLPNSININEVNVFVDIAHSYIGDLKVTIISPTGTSVVLHDRSGGSSDGLLTWYDTQTQPAQPLSAFIGENSAGTWILRVEDLAGGDTGTLQGWKLEICGQGGSPAPSLIVNGSSVEDTGACHADSVADVGETVTYKVTIKNRGQRPATGVSASLSSTSKVDVLNNPVILSDLAVGQETEARFLVKIGAVTCLEQALFTVSMTATEGNWIDDFTDTLEADNIDETSTETVEHGGAEPVGWSHGASQGTDNWGVVDTKNHTDSGVYAWFSSDTATTKDSYLYTPSYTLVGSQSSLDFYHWVAMYTGADGGVLEITTDNGATWTDLGSSMTVGGYDQAMTAGPLSGRQAWTGKYTEWKHTVVNLNAWTGQTVRFRFRHACNESIAKNGWWIDDIVVKSQGTPCDTHPCGIPGEALLTSVVKNGSGVTLTWKADVLALSYKIFRASNPASASAFHDVTAEDGNPADNTFLDQSSGAFAAWIITVVGPDGEGPWGHFNQ